MNFSIFPGNVEKMDLFLDLKACPKQVENEEDSECIQMEWEIIIFGAEKSLYREGKKV